MDPWMLSLHPLRAQEEPTKLLAMDQAWDDAQSFGSMLTSNWRLLCMSVHFSEQENCKTHL